MVCWRRGAFHADVVAEWHRLLLPRLHNNTGHVTVVMATMVSVMAVVMAMAEMAMVVAMVIPVTSK